MNNYELLYILSTSATSEEIKASFLEIEKNVLKLGGKKLKTPLDHPFLVKAETSKEENAEELKSLPIVKRRLAYPIKKNRTGFYCLFNFSSEPGSVKKIDDYLRMNNVVVRHLIVQADPMTDGEIQLLEKLFARKRAEQEKQEKDKQEKPKPKEKEIKKETKKEVEKEEVILKEKKPESKLASEDKAEEVKEEVKIEKEEVKEKAEKEEEKSIVKKVKEKEEVEKKEAKEEKVKTAKKKKIKLEDLEDKLDEILEDTSII